MIDAILRVLGLAWRAHVAWPAQPLDRVLVTSYVAVAHETRKVSAEILMVIAEHESDLRSNAVSWRRRDGQRVDILWDLRCARPAPFPGPEVSVIALGRTQALATTPEFPGLWALCPAAVIEPPARGPLACGLVQTIAADRARCAELLDPRVAIAAGVAEIETELRSCRGSMACALSLYAGGAAGLEAWKDGTETDATHFAAMFLARAGAIEPRKGM